MGARCRPKEEQQRTPPLLVIFVASGIYPQDCVKGPYPFALLAKPFFPPVSSQEKPLPCSRCDPGESNP